MRYPIKCVLVIITTSIACATAAFAQQQTYPSRPASPTSSTPTTSPAYDDCGAQNAQMGSSAASAPITGAGTNGQYGLKAPTNAGNNSLHARGYAATPASSAPSGYAIPGAGGYPTNPSARVYQPQAAAQSQSGQASPSLGVPQSRSGQSGYAVAHTNCGQARSNPVR